MTDLSMLFSSTVRDRPIESFMIQSKTSRKQLESSFITPTKKKQHWDLMQLEASIKKGIKRQVPLSALSQEIQVFSAKQKQQYRKKTLIFGGIIMLISYLVNLDRRIIFHLALLLFLKLVPSLPFSFIQETIIKKSSQIMTPLVYSALFYYLLKWATNAEMSELNLALTFTSIVFSIVFAVIQYVEPLFNLATEHIFFNTIKESEFWNGIIIFLSFIYQRLKFYNNVKVLLVGAFASSFVLLSAIFLYIKGEIMVFFKFKSFFIGFGLFLALDLSFLLFRYIDFFSEQIKILINKMHIFMALLRIEGQTSYRKTVQDKCLRNILFQTIQTPCFLATETCKSLIYETYMDLFNQLAAIQLQRAHSDIRDKLSTIKTNSMVISSDKTMIKDLFIKFRKAKAYILQQTTTIQSLESLSQVILLMRIIVLADQQAHTEKQPVKPNSRLAGMIEMIQQKLYVLASQQTLLPFLRAQLMFNERKLSGWISSMRKGWV